MAAAHPDISLPIAQRTLRHAADARAQIDQAFTKPAGVWYEGGLRFACSQCGHCCSGAPGYVWVTLDDMMKIAAHLKMDFDAFTRGYVRRVGTRYALVEHVNYDCVFLRRDPQTGRAGCAIYAVRPMQCRTWPFWNQNLRAPEAWTAAAERCPGMCDAEAPLQNLADIERCRTHPESP